MSDSLSNNVSRPSQSSSTNPVNIPQNRTDSKMDNRIASLTEQLQSLSDKLIKLKNLKSDYMGYKDGKEFDPEISKKFEHIQAADIDKFIDNVESSMKETKEKIIHLVTPKDANGLLKKENLDEKGLLKQELRPKFELPRKALEKMDLSSALHVRSQIDLTKPSTSQVINDKNMMRFDVMNLMVRELSKPAAQQKAGEVERLTKLYHELTSQVQEHQSKLDMVGSKSVENEKGSSSKSWSSSIKTTSSKLMQKLHIAKSGKEKIEEGISGSSRDAMKEVLFNYVTGSGNRSKVLVHHKKSGELILVDSSKATKEQKQEGLNTIVKFLKSEVDRGSYVVGVIQLDDGNTDAVTVGRVGTALTNRYGGLVDSPLKATFDFYDISTAVRGEGQESVWRDQANFALELMGDESVTNINTKSTQELSDGKVKVVSYRVGDVLGDEKAIRFKAALDARLRIMNDPSTVDDELKKFIQLTEPTMSPNSLKELLDKSFAQKMNYLALPLAQSANSGADTFKLIIRHKLNEFFAEEDYKAKEKIAERVVNSTGINMGDVRAFFKDPAQAANEFKGSLRDLMSLMQSPGADFSEKMSKIPMDVREVFLRELISQNLTNDEKSAIGGMMLGNIRDDILKDTSGKAIKTFFDDPVGYITIQVKIREAAAEMKANAATQKLAESNDGRHSN